MTREWEAGREHRPAWWDIANDRAMLICRISDRKQKDGVSLDAQEREARDYARRVGLHIVKARPFQESAKKSVLRRAFHAALEEAERLEIKHIVFSMWDRISRNFTDSEMLEELIRDDAITLHVAAGGTVLHAGSDDAAFFMFDINIAQAKQENRTRSTKTISGMTERCQKGQYPSRPPWFYWQQPLLDDDGRPKRRGSTIAGPTEEGRRLVRREMELHLRGFSLDLIRRKCLEEGLVPRKLIPRYHTSIVDRHLKCEFYAAIPNPHDGFKSQFTWRGNWYEAKHEPIFTVDEWERLKRSFGLKALYRKRKHEGLFVGSLSLNCEPCGCKITYAPKAKPSGKVYAYYRCADGRRIHRDRGEPQLNVLEDDILEQLGAAVAEIGLTPELAHAIAEGLNKTHRAAMSAKARAADGYRAEIRKLEEKENRLFDRFDVGEVDRETYDAQLKRIRTERDLCFEGLRTADGREDEKYLVTAERVLELASRAKTLWNGRGSVEKRDLVARLVCNPRLDGRTVRFDWRKPFNVLVKMRGVDGWRPQRDSNPRSASDSGDLRANPTQFAARGARSRNGRRRLGHPPRDAARGGRLGTRDRCRSRTLRRRRGARAARWSPRR